MFLLTGARGQAGQAVIDRAIKTNRRVKAIVRGSAFPLAPQVEILRADLRQLAEHRDSLKNVDGIIHLAAARKNTLRDDVFSDLRILFELLNNWQHGNFVFASSQIVYSPAAAPHSENAPCSPVAWYAAGKLMSEQVIQAHWHSRPKPWGLEHQWIALRIPVVLYRTRARSPQFLDYYVRAARKGKTFFWQCSEDEARTIGSSWIGERDLANALLDSLEVKLSGIFNIASGHLLWIDLIECLIRKLNSKSRIAFESSRGVRMPHSHSHLDCSKWSSTHPGSGPFCENLEEIVDEYLFRSQA